MYPFIRCPTCGHPLGHLYPAYVEEKAQMLMSLGLDEIDPATLALQDQPIDTGHILDALGIETECCRGHIMSQRMFYTAY